MSEEDRALLDRLLGEELNNYEREAFEGMRARLESHEVAILSPKQRAWAEDAANRVGVFGMGIASRGREVKMMFDKGPLRPPVR